MALQGRDAVCGTGSFHIQLATDCCGALHHHDEAATPEVGQEELLQDLWLGGTLLAFGHGDWLPPIDGLELCVQLGRMLHPPPSLLKVLHLFLSHHILHHPPGYWGALWCHLLPRTQECTAGPAAQSKALLGPA